MTKSIQKCVRPNAFYIFGGVICSLGHEPYQGVCMVEKVVNAINIGSSEDIFDSHPVLHKRDTRSYQTGYGVGVTNATSITGIDEKIYSSFVTVIGTPTNPCLYYYDNITSDGFYELILKTVENEFQEEHKRVSTF